MHSHAARQSRKPLSCTANVADHTPRIDRIVASSDNSPRNIILSNRFSKNCPMHPVSPSAMGKSDAEPPGEYLPALD